MSYNTDLQNNNTSLQEILATINSLPEAGSGGSGGAAIETCILNLNFNMSPGSSFSGVYCTTLLNGVVSTNYIECNNSSKTIENVILNSPVIILATSNDIKGIAITSGASGTSNCYNNIDGNGQVHIAIPTWVSSSTNKCSISVC